MSELMDSWQDLGSRFESCSDLLDFTSLSLLKLLDHRPPLTKFSASTIEINRINSPWSSSQVQAGPQGQVQVQGVPIQRQPVARCGRNFTIRRRSVGGRGRPQKVFLFCQILFIPHKGVTHPQDSSSSSPRWIKSLHRNRIVQKTYPMRYLFDGSNFLSRCKCVFRRFPVCTKIASTPRIQFCHFVFG